MQLSRWYLELFDAFSMLKEQYVRLQKERDSVEHQYQQLCDGWRLELEQKQAAFDHARACIMSQRFCLTSPVLSVDALITMFYKLCCKLCLGQ